MNRSIKKLCLATAAVAVLGLGASPASADDYRCDAPMTEWQPRENLQKKLEAEGWQVKRIKTDDGCYEVYAFDKDGNRVEASFDPKSLEMLRKKKDD
ncbi:MAG: PepSY domain-containing protein [Rhodospirillales bacterium]|nr:PepSY domain-containing protein [Rhodospirillales bacterium]